MTFDSVRRVQMSRAYPRPSPPLITIAGFALLFGVASFQRTQGASCSGGTTLVTNAVAEFSPVGSAAGVCGQADRKVDDRPAGQVFKNIQVLKDIPASQLNAAMDFMSASLGVGCVYCHTKDLASDEKSTKATTRQMLVMTANINKQSFSGFNVVNCYTCHRGRSEPASVPQIDESTLRLPQAAFADSSGGLPSADTLIAKYEAAIGGIDAVQKIVTSVAIGEQILYEVGHAPETAAVEIYHKAPDKFLYSVDAPGGTASIDGARPGRRETLRAELAGDFFEYLNLKQTFPSIRVLSRERLGDRAVTVAGAVGRDSARVKLYFDAGSGLLVRRESLVKTPLGTLPDVIDFENYRKVQGMELPFRISRSRPPTAVVEEFREIKINVPIDDSRFAARGR
jgi:hypothetical protein